MANISLAPVSVAPAPCARFSPLHTIKSGRYFSFREGKTRASASRPGRAKMSPKKRMFIFSLLSCEFKHSGFPDDVDLDLARIFQLLLDAVRHRARELARAQVVYLFGRHE